ncbi:hypothetical protein NCC49_005964 [Naganishia albida]|nr:hypothetical protein NCC49_005964 [Naganishia albida]
MIDSGATGNFIHSRVVQRYGLKLKRLSEPMPISVIDGRPIASGRLTHEATPIRLTTGAHSKIIRLLPTILGQHDVILGLPWLQKHNPSIDWNKGEIVFRNETYSPGRQPSTHNIRVISISEAKNLIFSNKAQGWVVDLHRDEGGLKINAVENSEGSYIPEEFREFLPIFSSVSAEGLPEHSVYDHEISIPPNAKPPAGPLNSLPETELKALDEYLQENLAKGFIRPSSSSCAAPILFARKKDGSLRLCVDYRRLSTLTIKDRYPLPLIQESLNRLRSAKIYSKIALRGAYNLIRIKEGDEWKTAFKTRYGLFEYTPKTVKQVQSFLGFANFYRKFIKGYSHVTAPITRLLKTNVPFVWDTATSHAFRTLKAAFTSAPILCHFDPSRPVVLECDASDFAIAGVLSHPTEDGLLQPIAFYSRKMDAHPRSRAPFANMSIDFMAFPRISSPTEALGSMPSFGTERANQQIEQYLRIFCNDEQNNWADFLDLAG